MDLKEKMQKFTNDNKLGGLVQKEEKLVKQNQIDEQIDHDLEEAQQSQGGGASLIEPVCSQQRLRVLVVDDNYYNVFAVVSLFKQFQIEVDTAGDGVQAQQMVKKLYLSKMTTYDLIMMDYAMPQCDGAEATKGIRKYLDDAPEQIQQTYICCLTAY